MNKTNVSYLVIVTLLIAPLNVRFSRNTCILYVYAYGLRDLMQTA